MTRQLMPVEKTTPTSEELQEAQRIVKRLDEFDDTIEIWESKMNHAAQKLKETRACKERYIKSVQANTLPFYIPSCDRSHNA